LGQGADDSSGPASPDAGRGNRQRRQSRLRLFCRNRLQHFVKDADNDLVAFIPTAFDLGGTSYQPLDSDLTAIAALATTGFGRGFLTLADAAAARALLALGSAATLDKATAAQFRANTADKVLTPDNVWGAAASVALAQVAGAVAVDLNLGLNFTLAMTGTPWTLSSPTNGKDGQSGKIEITQDATGNSIARLRR
jgi:hypothetical protein